MTGTAASAARLLPRDRRRAGRRAGARATRTREDDMQNAAATAPVANPMRARVMRLCAAAIVAVGVTVLALAAATPLLAATPSFTDWSAPMNLGPAINTTAGEGGPALSADSLSLY